MGDKTAITKETVDRQLAAAQAESAALRSILVRLEPLFDNKGFLSKANGLAWKALLGEIRTILTSALLQRLTVQDAD